MKSNEKLKEKSFTKNELVSDNIVIQTKSKKETNKIKLVSFDKDEQNNLKLFSKIFGIIAAIFKVFAIIGIPFMILVMIVIPSLIKSINITNDEITFSSPNNNIKIVNEDDKTVISYNKIRIAEVDDLEFVPIVNKLMGGVSKKNIIKDCEFELFFLLVNMVVLIFVLKYLEKLAKNINTLDTPFNKDNVYLIRKIAYLLTIIAIVSTLSDMFISSPILGNQMFSLNLEKVFIILGMYVLAYIFDYGTSLQINSKERVYDHE